MALETGLETEHCRRRQPQTRVSRRQLQVELCTDRAIKTGRGSGSPLSPRQRWRASPPPVRVPICEAVDQRCDKGSKTLVRTPQFSRRSCSSLEICQKLLGERFSPVITLRLGELNTALSIFHRCRDSTRDPPA